MKEKIKKWFKNNWFKIIVIGFLLGALADNPYGYYQFLRWIVLMGGTYSAYLCHLTKKKGWTILFVSIAILFNPIIPFYFSKDTWQLIDVGVAVIFFASLFSKIKKNNDVPKN